MNLACVLGLACLGVVPGDRQAPAQTEASVLVSYDLRGVLPRWDESTTWSQGLLVPPAGSPYQELPSASGVYGEVASFELLDLMSQVLGDELRREGRELVVEGTSLTVLAPEGVQEQVRSVLDALRQALGGTIPVRVDVLALSEGSSIELVPSSTLGEEEAAKLVATLVGRGAQHRSFQLELSAGRTAWLDARRRIPFLFDYNVEIAQAAMVFDPVLAETFDGVRLGLRGVPVTGGLALSAVFLRSDLLGKIGERKIVVRGLVNQPESQAAELIEGPGTIQVPEVLVRGLAFDTLIPDGKALALTLEADLGATRVREVVLLRRMGGSMTSYLVRQIPRTNRTLIALNAELFRAPRLTSSSEPTEQDYGPPLPQAVATLDGETPSFLLEWLKVRFSVWRRLGPWILIVTDPAWDRDAPGELARLLESRRGDARLLTLGVDLRAQGRENPFPVRLRLPVREGSSAGLVVARGTTAVIDFDVEVAQSAAVPDPTVECLFEGLALALTVERTSCEVSGMAQLFDATPVSLDLAYAMMGAIERPEPRYLDFDERLNLTEGTPGRARIGVTSDRADQPGMAVELSISGR